jgi:competence protein ComEA
VDDPLADLRGASDLRTRLGSLFGDRPSWLGPVLVGVVVLVVVATFVLTRVLAPAAPLPETYLPVAEPVQGPTTSAVVAEGTVTVHVAGAVASPGLIETDQGKRVGDAVKLAGGALARADVDRLNLAEPLIDGIRVYVPRIGEDFVVEPLATAGEESPEQPAVVNINTADTTELETLPGVGPVTAAAIIAHRTDNGAFDAVEDLEAVSGIGPKTMSALLPQLTVGP